MALELTESKSAFAKRLNASKARISQLVKAGLPCTSQGQVRIDAALRWIRENVNASPGRPQGSANSDDGELLAARVRLVTLQADRAETELAVRRGELISKHAAAIGVRAMVRTLRDNILNIPSRYGAEIAAELDVDHPKLAAALEVLLRNALVEIAKRPRPSYFEAEALASQPAIWEKGGL
ncbi:hypothetical protein EN742_13910 [Mesorhizobium sp. M4A.F.Ca.ET.020.02.1.1]|uniref:hypothetical protein n=1 Tax=unclassified Mesorhizobium TaxID=325217 RepID=UPI000FD3F937|nr:MULTISPECIES: hypothetical protein [unclassified Mesorhizobium]RVD39942.1 hypothetical protein EN742_13910 [Mesorhizobium sp. M4A.F.Ca.ET.020.02.1.1]RWC20044.1 MAG: hypothetical protein EOS53_11020 [Mesorhizobium sp.]TIX62976.1 MAG: hypothetical protein E5V33_13885 [Mesorhizobium sp.]